MKSLIQLGQKEKQFGGVIFGSKLTLNHRSRKEEEEMGDDQGLRRREEREEERYGKIQFVLFDLVYV